jgi:hypothetical protein
MMEERVVRGILLAAFMVIGGCRAGVKGVEFRTPPGVSPSVAVARGDWDDVEASAVIAAGRAEMAVITVSPSDDRIVIDLTTVGDEPARVVVRRSAGDESLLEAECRVGRFGEPAWERRFLAALARRLGELYRRDTAPVRF